MPHRIKISFLCTLFLCGTVFLAGVSVAQETAKLPPEEQLLKIRQQIDQQNQSDNVLGVREATIGTQISELNNTLATIDRQNRDAELLLRQIDQRLDVLQQSTDQKQAELLERYRKIGGIIAAWLQLDGNLTNLPIIYPGGSKDAVQSAVLMDRIIPELHNNAQLVAQELVAIEQLQRVIFDEKNKRTIEQTTLTRNEQRLRTLLLAKQKLFSDTKKERTLVQNRRRALAQSAKTIEELLKKIAQEKQQQTQPPSPSSDSLTSKLARAFPSRRQQNLTPPALGTILLDWQQDNADGVRTEGLVIRARRNTSVRSPFDGQVVYAQVFNQRLGIIVLIEHKGGYMSVLHGIEETYVSEEQWVREGETIGRVGASGRLTFEIRQGTKPLNPRRFLVVGKDGQVG